MGATGLEPTTSTVSRWPWLCKLLIRIHFRGIRHLLFPNCSQLSCRVATTVRCGTKIDTPNWCGVYCLTVRYLTALASALLLVAGLLTSPFVHVHLQSDRDRGHLGLTVTTVHAHLPRAHGDPEAAHDLSVLEAEHSDGEIDLFLLLIGKALPHAQLRDQSSDLTPPSHLVRQWVAEPTRVPGSLPRRALLPRAPPA